MKLTIIRGLLAAVSLLGLSGGCTNAGGARHALEAQGFKSIDIGGYSFFGCSKSDDTCTKFEATGPTGVRVRGVVGCGYVLKGCTVRFE